MSYKHILVLKDKAKSNNDSGEVIPFATQDDNGLIEFLPDIDSKYPPNGKIYISNTYNNIEEKYSPYEVFALPEDRLSESAEWFASDRSPAHARYKIGGAWASDIKPSYCLPIFFIDFPDLATGLVKSDYDDLKKIGKKSFFISNATIVAGPFVYEGTDDAGNLKITPSNTTNPLGLAPYFIAEFQLGNLDNLGLILKIGTNNKLWFLTSLHDAKQKINSGELEWKSKDQITDARLIVLFGDIKHLTKRTPLLPEAKKLKSAIEEWSKSPHKQQNNDIDEREKRVKQLLDEYVKDHDTSSKNPLKEFLSSSEGKLFLSHSGIEPSLYIKKSSSDTDEKQKFEAELARLETKIATNKAELKTAEADFSKFEESEHKRKQDVKNSIDQEIEEYKRQSDRQKQDSLNDETKELEQKLQLLKEIVGEYESLEDVKEAIKENRNFLKYAEQSLKDKEKELEEVGKRRNNQKRLFEAPEFLDKGLEFDTLRQLVNGVSRPIPDSKIKELAKYATTLQIEGESRKSYIKDLMKGFARLEGPSYSYEETANLLLSTLQSYITILAGPPGVGKTSTANHFGFVMGLRADDKKNDEVDGFLNIAIGRGWTSSREMIGFYNSLKNTYQPSRSGLYQFLKAFSSGNSNPEYLKLALMDEANLSSMEHYWSDFLGWCDSIDEMKDHELNLGITDRLIIPKSLRFIGTINNDETVESLSPRLIDRASIITLDYDNRSMSTIHRNSITESLGAIPYAELMQAFYHLNPDNENYYNNQDRLTEILEILKTAKPAIRYSARKENAIRRYCLIADELGFEKNEPLDFAISQHILPAIRGSGAHFKETLETLRDKLQSYNYSISTKIVSDIIVKGDDFSHSYSFF